MIESKNTGLALEYKPLMLPLRKEATFVDTYLIHRYSLLCEQFKNAGRIQIRS